METISRSLLTFLLNSLWQIPVAAAVAALACRFMRNGPASHRHAVWVAALAASLLLPLASVRPGPPAATPQFAISMPDINVKPAPHQSTPLPGVVVPARASRTISFAATTASILLSAYFLFVLFRLARLGWASLRTVQLRSGAEFRAIPETLDRVWMRCQETFELTAVELLVSAQVSGPVTAGGAIILPESLLSETSEDVLTTVIGHEMAHIARRDFSSNLLYELLYLPVSFHPAAWLIHGEIERTREMACDELVTHRLMDTEAYARSILRIANGMMALPRPGYTLGVFDGDILEARIRRLMERPAANLKRARLLLASGLAALGLCAAIASSLALSARAQGGARAVMKQAEALYNRGDYKGAADLFENAVKVEPSNLKAKLLLANTLLRDYAQGGEPDTVMARARQQYLDVLAVEPGNRQALQGLMLMYTNTKQFAEARQWALKAIQADAANKGAYYTIGFIDWAVTYPDYASARQAAGMRPQDPGIIPDAGLRQKVRTQHGAQIEDGFRMLQIAIQLDPDYSDAMAYMNLLYRIEAGIADTPAQSAEAVAKADAWVTQALDAKRRAARTPRPPAAGVLDVDGPAPGPPTVPPPPPPPPPLPPGASQARMEAPGAIRVSGEEQQARLVRQAPPIFPTAAREAGTSGVVRLSVVIARDGRVRDVRVMNGAGLPLDVAAMEAVKQWVYKPALLNGEPVEVVTTVEVNFAPGR